MIKYTAMEPYISLKIQNHIPQIIYFPKEGASKKLTSEDQSIYEVIIPIAKKLNLVDRELVENDSEILPELLDLARQSDELYITDLPEIEGDSLEFNLNSTLNKILDDILDEQNYEYSDLAMSNEVKKEINKNQNSDIFASILEIMYITLIAKTILAASELGIGKIKLEDEGKNARLMEKMAKELEKLGVEFFF